MPTRRSDFQLATKAIREGWAVPLRTKTALVDEAFRLALDPATHVRMVLAAARFILAAVRADQEAELAAQRKPFAKRT